MTIKRLPYALHASFRSVARGAHIVLAQRVRRPTFPASLLHWLFNCDVLGWSKNNLIRGEQPAQACLTARWEHYAHGADIGVRGIGPTVEEAFEQAAIALAGVITDPSRVEPKEEVIIQCQAPDREVLLVDWLNALVYEMAVRRCILGRFRVGIEGTHLQGRAWGEEVDVVRHEPAVEVKGATFTDLFVGQNSDGAWVAQCVVDV